MAEKKQCDEVLNMAAIFVIVQKFVFLLKYNHAKIYFDNRNKPYKKSALLWDAFGAQFCQKSTFWRIDFQNKNQINGKQ